MHWQFNADLCFGICGIFEIVAKAPHKDSHSYGMLYLVRNKKGQCYLFSEKGLELVED